MILELLQQLNDIRCMKSAYHLRVVDFDPVRWYVLDLCVSDLYQIIYIVLVRQMRSLQGFAYAMELSVSSS